MGQMFSWSAYSSSYSSSSGVNNWTNALHYFPNVNAAYLCGFTENIYKKLHEHTDLMLEDVITKVTSYETPSHPYISDILSHMFIVIETKGKWYYSIEKDSMGIILQRSKNLQDLLANFRNSRRIGTPLVVEVKEGVKTVGQLIELIQDTGELTREYSVLSEELHCHGFAKRVLTHASE